MVCVWDKILGVQDSDSLDILKWVVAETKGEGHTAKHPHISLGVDWELHVFVDHLGGTVHHRRVLLVLIHALVDLVRGGRLGVEGGTGCRSEVAKFEIFPV